DVNITPGAVATQTNPCTIVASQVVSTNVAHFQAGAAGPLGVTVANGVDLNDTPSVSGVDAASPFQWTSHLHSWNAGHDGGTNKPRFTITKELAPVPEPLTMLLLGTGLLTLGRAARRGRMAAV